MYHHGLGPAARRRQEVKAAGILERTGGTFRIGKKDVAALHERATHGYFRDGDIGLSLNDRQLAQIRVVSAHGVAQFVLPLEPLHVHGITFLANDGEFIALPYALARTFADVN